MSPYRELFVDNPAVIAEEAREQREREASGFLERIGVFAREQNASVVAVHPIDFRAVVAVLNIRVEFGSAPTPRSLRCEYFMMATHRGFVDVVSEPNALREELCKPSFSGVLPSEANDPERAEQEGQDVEH